MNTGIISLRHHVAHLNKTCEFMHESCKDAFRQYIEAHNKVISAMQTMKTVEISHQDLKRLIETKDRYKEKSDWFHSIHKFELKKLNHAENCLDHLQSLENELIKFK